MPKDYGSHLYEQLDALRRFSNSYDRGSRHDMARMAAALRVIFYDRGSSVSLISHLNAHNIQMLSTADVPKAPTDFFPALTYLSLAPDRLHFEWLPFLGRRLRRFVCLADWWENELVYQDPYSVFTINRCDLVKAVADKEGGAHVDSTSDPRFEALEAGAGWEMTVNPPHHQVSIVEPAKYAVHSAIRQITYEALHSAQLRNLARRRSR